MRLPALFLVLAACSSDDTGLTRADVEHLPPGTATGTQASGAYELEMLTVACHGTCPVIHLHGFSAPTCDVNELDDAELEVTQTDGALVMNADGLVVDRLTGGIDADGSYRVGAYGTEAGGEVAVLVRSTGQLAGAQFTGMSEARMVGLIGSTRVDCTTIYEVTGARVR